MRHRAKGRKCAPGFHLKRKGPGKGRKCVRSHKR